MNDSSSNIVDISENEISQILPILSWDVGIYNLSYCILQKELILGGEIPTYTVKILKWGILPICNRESLKKDKMGVFERIPIVLNTIPELINVSDVLIENQPCLKNPTMKSIQVILYSYFIFNKQNGLKLLGNESNIKNVEYVSACNKLKIYDGPELESKLKSSYSRRKFYAIKHAEYFLNKYNELEYLEYYKSNKKKDDLADSYLQGLFFIKREHDKQFKPKRQRRTRKKKE